MTDLVRADSSYDNLERLKVALRVAQQELVAAEAELATEQAVVNAFRMHSRLMLDDLVDRIDELLSEKQAALTRLQLLRQAEQEAAGEEDDPLGPPPDAAVDDDGRVPPVVVQSQVPVGVDQRGQQTAVFTEVPDANPVFARQKMALACQSCGRSSGAAVNSFVPSELGRPHR